MKGARPPRYLSHRKFQVCPSVRPALPHRYAWLPDIRQVINQAGGFSMNRISWRHVAASMALVASVALSPAFAGQAPAAPAAPAKPYVMPSGVPDYIRKAVQLPERPEAMT